MKALKGLMVYIGIVIAIVALLCAGLFGVMYFVPSFKIMGVGVVNTTSVKSDKIFLKDYADIENIQLNITGENINYSVVPYEYNEKNDKDLIGRTIDFSISVKQFGVGFDSTECGIIKKIKQEGKLLKVDFVITETSGLLSRSGKGVTIKIPNDNDIVYDMFLTTKDANISLGSDKPININSLSVSTNNGDLYVSNIGTVEKINEENIRTLELNNLSLQTSGMGNFDFSSVNNLRVKNTIKLTAKRGDFRFRNIYADLDARGSDVALYADTITTKTEGLKFLTESGYFQVNKIVTANDIENMIVTNNCEVNVKEISGRTGIDTEYGNITISVLHDDAILYSKHGNIAIFQAKSDISAKSEFGNIKVDEYYGIGLFKNVKGNIVVASKSEFSSQIWSEIENVDGDIQVTNNCNRLLVNNKKGSGRAIINFSNVQLGLDDTTSFQHKVELNSRAQHRVFINALPVVNKNAAFKFKAVGLITGNIAGFNNDQSGTDGESDEEKWQYYPNNTPDYIGYSSAACFFYFEGKIEFVTSEYSAY